MFSSLRRPSSSSHALLPPSSSVAPWLRRSAGVPLRSASVTFLPLRRRLGACALPRPLPSCSLGHFDLRDPLSRTLPWRGCVAGSRSAAGLRRRCEPVAATSRARRSAVSPRPASASSWRRQGARLGASRPPLTLISMCPMRLGGPCARRRRFGPAQRPRAGRNGHQPSPRGAHWRSVPRPRTRATGALPHPPPSSCWPVPLCHRVRSAALRRRPRTSRRSALGSIERELLVVFVAFLRGLSPFHLGGGRLSALRRALPGNGHSVDFALAPEAAVAAGRLRHSRSGCGRELAAAASPP